MKIKIFLFVIASILVINLSYATLDIKIDVAYSFASGQNMYFVYTINSSTNQAIIFIPYIFCPNAPNGFLNQKTANLKSNELYSDRYDGGLVDKITEPQTCTAYVQIISPVQQIFSKNFSIATKPGFNFEIEMSKKVFVKGEDIYLNYSSSVANPSVSAVLTYPDKTIRQITLPTTIKAEQIGTYVLEANASKEGYKEEVVKELFGVIGTASNVAYQNVSNVAEAGKTGVNKKYLLYALLGMLLLILAFIIWYLITHSRGNEVSGQESLAEETQTQNSS